MEREEIQPWWIEAALAAVGLAQVDLAEMLEVSPVTVNRWIKGRRSFGRLEWLAILHALDLPKGWRPRGKPPTSKESTSKPSKASPKTKSTTGKRKAKGPGPADPADPAEVQPTDTPQASPAPASGTQSTGPVSVTVREPIVKLRRARIALSFITADLVARAELADLAALSADLERSLADLDPDRRMGPAAPRLSEASSTDVLKSALAGAGAALDDLREWGGSDEATGKVAALADAITGSLAAATSPPAALL